MHSGGTTQPASTSEPAATSSAPCGSTPAEWSVDTADLIDGPDDERCIYALDSRDGSVYTLRENALTGQPGDALKVELDEFMRCLGCGNTITARHYADRRDHFYHSRKVRGCSPTARVEGAWHRLSKHVLREWLTSNGFKAREEAWSRDRSGRADVLAWIRKPVVGDVNEATVAFEVQYTALGDTQWNKRHATWAAEPAADVWLFGHHGHNHRTRGASLHVTLNTTHQAVINSGQPLLWINPLDRTVGTALVERSHRGSVYLVPPDMTDKRVTVDWVQFEQCTVTENGISHPAYRNGLDNLADLERVRTLPDPEPEPGIRPRQHQTPPQAADDSRPRDGQTQPPYEGAPSTWEQLWNHARKYGALDPWRVHYVHNREPLTIEQRMLRWRAFNETPARP